MKLTGNLRKMGSSLTGDLAHYNLRMCDVLEPLAEVELNSWVGHTVRMQWEGKINCVETGKSIKKTYGEGMSFDAWRVSPRAVESIIRPELSRIHEGIALRDMEWEMEHHNKPHYVYLSHTSGVKVGVTRTSNVPSRWIDQGAVQAVAIAETPYRQLAGEMEVALKEHFNDRTQWQAMLKGVDPHAVDLHALREEVFDLLGEAYGDFYRYDDGITAIRYPVEQYLPKVSSLKLEKMPEIESRLVGIKGQYLLFGNGMVFNVRSHAGYRIALERLD